MAIREDIQEYIKRFFDAQHSPVGTGTEDASQDYDFPDTEFEEEEEEDEVDEADEASGKVVKLVDQIIIAAFRKNASDIHIEPSSISKTTGRKDQIQAQRGAGFRVAGRHDTGRRGL